MSEALEVDCAKSVVDQGFVKKLLEEITVYVVKSEASLVAKQPEKKEDDATVPQPVEELPQPTCFPWYIPQEFFKTKASPELGKCFRKQKKVRLSKVIAFLNPLSATYDELKSLYDNEVRIFIVQIKYGTPTYFNRLMDNLKKLQRDVSPPHVMTVPIAIGLEIRGRVAVVGRLKKNKDVYLKVGEEVIITNDRVYSFCCTTAHLYVNCSAFLPLLHVNDEICIEGGIILTVNEVECPRIRCTVAECGTIKSFATVTFPYELYRYDQLINEEVIDFCSAHKHNMQFVLVPHLINPLYGCFLKRKLYQMGTNFGIFCQVSRHQLDTDELDKFVKLFDGVLIPGYNKYDPMEEKEQQKYLMDKFKEAHKRVLFKYNTAPAVKIPRSVYYNIDCLVIERNEKQKKFPCPTELEILCCLAEDTTKDIMKKLKNVKLDADCSSLFSAMHVTDNSGMNAAERRLLAHKRAVDNCQQVINGCLTLSSNVSRITSIFVLTKTGQAAIKLAIERPLCTIIAITKCIRVAKNLLLWRNIYTVLYIKGNPEKSADCGWAHEICKQFNHGVEIAKRLDWVESGDRILFLFNSCKKSEFFDTFQILNIH